MSLPQPLTVREVHGIDAESEQAIRLFLQGAVYCWCKNRPEEWFSLGQLMGGDNYHWEGTPLFALFEKQVRLENSDDPVTRAGIDAGWILLSVLDEDRREFESSKKERHGKNTRSYRWVNEDS